MHTRNSTLVTQHKYAISATAKRLLPGTSARVSSSRRYVHMCVYLYACVNFCSSICTIHRHCTTSTRLRRAFAAQQRDSLSMRSECFSLSHALFLCLSHKHSELSAPTVLYTHPRTHTSTFLNTHASTLTKTTQKRSLTAALSPDLPLPLPLPHQGPPLPRFPPRKTARTRNNPHAFWKSWSLSIWETRPSTW